MATELIDGILAAISKKLRQALKLEPQQAALAEYYCAGAAAGLPEDDPNWKRLWPILCNFLPSQ